MDYKHKKTGNIATPYGDAGYILKNKTGFIASWMIEDSCDWEKIEPVVYPAGTVIKDDWTQITYTKNLDGKWSSGSINTFGIEDERIAKGDRFKVLEEKKVLVVTNDGKSIHEGDSYFIISEEATHKIQERKGDKYMKYSYTMKRFSTRENAEDHLIYNHKCLSINEVAKVYTSANVNPDKYSGAYKNQARELREMVKQILKL